MLLQNCSYPRDERVRHEARALSSHGYEVSVIAPSLPGQAWRESLDGVEVFRFPAPPASGGVVGYLWEYLYSMIAIFGISLYVFAYKGIDAIHTHHPPDSFAIIMAFYKIIGKRVVLDHHDLAPELYNARFTGRSNGIIFGILVLLEKLACRLANRIIATNQSYKEMEMIRGRVPDWRITIVRNGPDLNELAPTDPFPQFRQKARFIIGYVGVTGTQDGVDHLLRAIKHLLVQFPRGDILCLIVGSGDALSRLQSLARKLGITDRVVFTGWIELPLDVGRYLSSMDICAAPEPLDPYNNRSTAAKVMEYMAMGKPVVAFDLREHRYSAQGAALYAVPNSELDYANKIAELMDSPELREDMGRMGRKRIEAELAWNHQEKALLQAYESLWGEYS